MSCCDYDLLRGLNPMGPAGGSDVFDLSGLELVNIPLSLPCLCTAEPSRPDLLELAEPAIYKMGSNL